MMNVRRLVSAALVVVVLGSGVVPPAEEAGAASGEAPWPWFLPQPEFIEPVPETDPFYRPPANIGSLAPGDIVRSRPVQVGVFGIFPVGVSAWHVAFRSTNPHGKPEMGVTTVLVPNGTAPPGGRPLLSYQIAINSLGTRCAPSRQLLANTLPTNAIVHAEFLLAASGLQQGFTVTIPDHLGPRSAYPSGPQSARHTLDAIRATERFTGAQVNGTQTRVGLMGYSGGAVASGWAAEMAPTYAPELNIVGAVQGGVPTNLENLVLDNNGTVYAGIGAAGLIGMVRAHPEGEAILRDSLSLYGGLRLAPLRDACVDQILALGAFTDAFRISTLPDVIDNPVLRAIQAEETRGRTMPTAPLYVYHSTGDILPVEDLDELIDSYCANGVDVTYHRDTGSDIIPDPISPQGGVAHIALAVGGAPAGMKWIADRLHGSPAPEGCSIRTAPTSLTDPGVPEFTARYLAGLVPLIGKPPALPGELTNSAFE